MSIMKKLFLFTTLLMLMTAAVLPVTGCNSKKNNNNLLLLLHNYATVTTASITDSDGTTATGGGNVTDNDAATSITARGICWSTSPNPTITALHTTNTGTTGPYTSNLTGLTIDTIYYVRAYATNSGGTAYGNEISFNTGKSFGSLFGGGLVFYNDGNGGGLVAATTDQSIGVQWHSGVDVLTSATGLLVGTGQANTSAIVTVQGGGTYAAEICDILVQFGHSDWFLPSQDELNLMYVNLHQRGWGGFANNNYWTSTEVDLGNARAQSFIIGVQSTQTKSQTYYVRAIRAF